MIGGARIKKGGGGLEQVDNVATRPEKLRGLILGLDFKRRKEFE